MAEPSYEAIASKADDILLDLLTRAPLGNGAEEMCVAIKALQPAFNANLHAVVPEFVMGAVRIAAAGPVPNQRIPMRILLEMIDRGVKVGMWMVDFDGIGRLRRREEGYLRVQRVDDGVPEGNATASAYHPSGRHTKPQAWSRKQRHRITTV